MLAVHQVDQVAHDVVEFEVLWRVDRGDPFATKSRGICFGDDAASDDRYIAKACGLKSLHDLWDQCEVRAAQNAEADQMDAFFSFGS